LSGDRRFFGLLARSLPPVGGKPAGQMPEGLYAYVLAVSRRQQVPLCLLTFLVFPLTLAPLELQRRIINEAIGGRQLELLFWLGGIYLAVALSQGALKYLRNVYLERVGQGVARRLRRRIAGSQAIGAEMPEGTRQTLMAVEAEDVGGFVSESLAFLLLQAGIVVSIAGYMLFVDPAVAVVALGFFVPSIILVAVVQPRLNRLTGKKTRTQRWLGEVVLEDHRTDVEGDALPRRIDRLIEHLYGLKIRIARLKYLTKVVTNLLGHLGPLSILVIGGWLVIRGDSTLGTIVAFVSGYDKMTEPARELLNFYRRLSMMRVQYGLVRDAANGGGQQPARAP
jgi:ABC-type bacteriocin/lantibiotic exporter with double-glycine peptidase domain